EGRAGAFMTDRSALDVFGELEEQRRRREAADGVAGGGRPTVFLHAGHLHVASEPTSITTIVGSCVAVCLWVPRIAVGGMNHYQLPLPAAGTAASPRFGSAAIRMLLDRIVALGARRDEIQAKLFGGACVLESFKRREDHLGTKNVEVAYSVLA